jgi:succinate-semialdehyde dehydrogenase/glutarate-semialdehyde dehydrogenase
MLNNPLLKKISFTGSTRVGRLLMDGASKTNTKLSLEMGGNAPVIINDDVNVDALAKSAVLAKLRNAGQVCIAPQRFFVHEKIYEPFLQAASEHIKNIKVGYGLEAGTQMGPLINLKQQQHVLQVIDDAEKSGAASVKGTIPSNKGWFVPPTLLSNIDANNEAVNKEIFGPVMPIIPFGSRNEVVEWANNTPYGLASYVWTNNINDAFFFAEKIEFGMVGINEWAPHATEAPFIGWKQSGIGHESGSEGLFEYMEKKLISWGV